MALGLPEVVERTFMDDGDGKPTRQLRRLISSFILSSKQSPPHKDVEEVYVCDHNHRCFDEMFFYHEGGVDFCDVVAKALRFAIIVGEAIDEP